ncbi:DUF1549 and DUF1553 domain-containing protein [Thalassoglobus sp. JC818]|uniref:DUF1549 and DUF1553 domain-containing protein n=1 Tax=Thalassoglobus sp. JC818 TaxID=3232136 RepID=UPI0034584082
MNDLSKLLSKLCCSVFCISVLSWTGLELAHASKPSASNESETEHVSLDEPEITEADRDYWAYQPVERPPVPEVANIDLCNNPIDQFIIARLEDKGLKPVPLATKQQLIRRVTFDLIGLPPTQSEIAEFLEDNSPDAYERLVTALLNRPGYGERWAQHWLDLVRFAETDGFEHDHVRPEAWRYRDWVIKAFNDGLPYDEFLRLQIAGDEIAPDSSDALIATGFLLAGPDMPDINLQEERRHNFLNGIAANIGEVILGLRFGCAQCHHHRTDPISQQDFYRIRSFFEPLDLFKDHSLPEAGAEPSKARVAKNLAKNVPVSKVYMKGDFRRPGPEISPQFPRVIQTNAELQELDESAHGRRIAFAQWLTAPDHPLTARVIVNRIWHHHFGEGLIGTTSDFGWMGDSATHPKLLDWLAAELIDSGWNLKALHSLIVNSATYQRASLPTENLSAEDKAIWEELIEQDRNNRLLGRRNRRRLESEAIRDSMLSVSGELNRQTGGPGVRTELPKAVTSTLLKNHWKVTEDPAEHDRRTIYLFMRRNLRLPFLEAFDKPDANLSCPVRSKTTIAPQALHLLNSDFARERATAFAARLTQEVDSGADSQPERINLAYDLCFSRKPNVQELTNCLAFLNDHPDDEVALIDLCHALMNLNEFIYID